MNKLFLSVSKNIKYYFILISFFTSCYLVWLVSSDFDKGFNLADESYYLNLYINPFSENFSFSYFHYIGSAIFIIAQKNLIILRYIGYVMLFLSVILFCYSILKSNLILKKGSLINFLLFTISIISINNYYGIHLFTPSYNLFNLCFITVFLSLSFLRFYYLKKDNILLNFFLSLFFFILTINKFSSAIFILIFFLIMFKKNISKRFLIQFFSFNLLISLFFFYFEFEKLKLLVNYLFFDENYKIFRHHEASLIIKEFSNLFSRFSTSDLKFYFIIFLILSFITKSNLNVFIILLIFIKFLILRENGGALSILAVYLFFYNLVLYFFYKKKIYLKNLRYLFYAYYICIAFWFGSNNELNRYINISSLFLYISFYLIFINNLNTKSEKKNELICFIFFLLIASNLYKVTQHHKKIDYSFREHINKNNLSLKTQYNSEVLRGLKVRNEFQEFVHNYNKILFYNNWKEGDYIIDTTLKNPGLIFLANANYIFKAWHLHNIDLLKITFESLDKDIKPWLILSKNNKVNSLVMNNFHPFEKNYNLVGIIEDPVNARLYEIYKPN